MTFVTTTELQCDECGADFSLDDNTYENMLRREAAEREGWTQTDDLLDLCRRCSK